MLSYELLQAPSDQYVYSYDWSAGDDFPDSGWTFVLFKESKTWLRKSWIILVVLY